MTVLSVWKLEGRPLESDWDSDPGSRTSGFRLYDLGQ